MIMFLFGVCLMQVVSEELLELGQDPECCKHLDSEALLGAYGTLTRTIFTLFKVICGGVDWGDVAEPLLAISPIMVVLFCAYVAFVALCVLNIITSVFVENAKQNTRRDEDRLLTEEFKTRAKLAEDIRQ